MGKNHVIGSPTRTVTINGRDYELELGNFSLALEAQHWAKSLEGLKEAPDAYEALEPIAEAGRAVVASALGDEAAEELVGGRHRLDIVRMLDLLGALVEEISSDGYAAELDEALGRFADVAE